MGAIRKITSVSTGGLVDFRSDKERIARRTNQTRKEAKKQTKLLSQAPPPVVVMPQQPGALPAAASGADQAERFRRLKELGELRDSGVLSASEFEVEKARILAEDHGETATRSRPVEKRVEDAVGALATGARKKLSEARSARREKKRDDHERMRPPNPIIGEGGRPFEYEPMDPPPELDEQGEPIPGT